MSDTGSSTELLAAAREVLTSSGFKEVTQYSLPGFDSSYSCLFEDAYSLATIVFYNTWEDLLRNWQHAQTAFVELISEHISSDDEKRWEGYLLLWTTDLVPTSEVEKAQQIEYNTGRVRKLLSTGQHLSQIGDVSQVLLPLLPITESFAQSADEGVLGRIPELLQSEHLTKQKILAVIDAFEKNESVLEAVHNFEEASE